MNGKKLLLNVLGVLGELNELNVLNKPKDTSLACCVVFNKFGQFIISINLFIPKSAK